MEFILQFVAIYHSRGSPVTFTCEIKKKLRSLIINEQAFFSTGSSGARRTEFVINWNAKLLQKKIYCMKFLKSFKAAQMFALNL